MLASRTPADSSRSSSTLSFLSYEPSSSVPVFPSLRIPEWQLPGFDEVKDRSTRRENRLYPSRFFAVLLCSLLAALTFQASRLGGYRAQASKDALELFPDLYETMGSTTENDDGIHPEVPHAIVEEDEYMNTPFSPSDDNEDKAKKHMSIEVFEFGGLTPEGPREPDSPFKERQHGFLGLPDMDGAEAAMPPDALRGKRFLESCIIKEEEEEEEWGGGEEDLAEGEEEPKVDDPAWTAVAKALSQGKREHLIGSTVTLTSTQPLDASLPAGSAERTLRVTRVLGRGSSSIVLGVIDEQTQEEFAMRLQVLEMLSLSQEETEKMMQKAIENETMCIRTAVDGVGASHAATKRGLALPLYTAKVAGAPGLMKYGDLYVSSSVQLLKRLHGSVKDIIDRMWRIPPEAKVYIARRLLLQILHLQASGVSHNDLRLDNCFMLPDGSFLLGDFGASAPFDCEMSELSRATIVYAEPQLLQDLYSFLYLDGPSVVAYPKGDLWSLGVVLFELFADGKLPFGLAGIHNDFAAMQSFAAKLVKGDYDQEAARAEISAELEKAQVPDSWQQLIRTLLEPSRSKRASWAQVAASFPDLF